MHVSINDPRAVTHVGPSVHLVCPTTCIKTSKSSSIDRDRGKRLKMEIEAEYISVFPPMHPELQEVLTLTVVEDTKSM